MKEKELNLKLIEKFPELKPKYEEKVNWQEGDDTGAHVVYGDVLSVSVIESIIYNDINLIKKHAKEKTLKVIKKFIAHDNENKKPI